MRRAISVHTRGHWPAVAAIDTVTLPFLDRLIAHDPSDDFWRKRRALAWLNLGDLKRAAADDPKLAVLPRDPRATASQIDLSAHYNRSLVKGGFNGSIECDLSRAAGQVAFIQAYSGVDQPGVTS